MLKKINKKYVYIIALLTLTISLIVGISYISSSFSLATGNITITSANTCSDSKLYDRLACMSVVESKKSKYVSDYINFGLKTQSKEEIETADEKNGKGLYEYTKTMNDTYPVYYYRGDVENNNIKFGGFCWKIVRTTSTGGTKIIYNGEPNGSGQCVDDSSISHNIGEANFGENNADYMILSDEVFTENLDGKSYYMQYNQDAHTEEDLYLSTEYTYDPETNYYTLTNPQTYSWENDYDSLEGYYYCSLTSSVNTCESLYYIVIPDYDSAQSVQLNDGEDLVSADIEMAFGTGYIDNGDGTYTLEEVRHIKKTEWRSYCYYGYNYVCMDNNETCSDIKSMSSTDNEKFYYRGMDESIDFGKNVTYDGSNYALQDTISVWDFSENNTDELYTLNNYNYTFYNLEDHTSVYNIRGRNFTPSISGKYFKAIKLINGNTTSTNYTDTSIKEMVEQWYEDNLQSVSSKVEDTIYCNDKRNFYYNEYITSRAQQRFLKGMIDLECDTEDSYSVSNTIGNGKLSYPIALLSLDEAIMAGVHEEYNDDKYTYLYNEESFYLMTPYRNEIDMFYLYKDQKKYSDSILSQYVRPVVSLKNSVQITSGTGTLNDPYIVS